MNYKEAITKRQEANFEIARILGSHEISEVRSIASAFRTCTEQYPQQRAGQIICNYICSDYRDPDRTEFTRVVLGALFPGDPDPFFEESVETLNRLKKS